MRTRARLSLLLLALGLVASTGVAEAQDIKPRSIKVSYGTAADHPFGLGVNKFVEIVARRRTGSSPSAATPTVSSGPKSPPSRPRKAGFWR